VKKADAGMAVELVGALGAASQRYDIIDMRIHDTLLDLFDHAADPVRIAIAQAIPHFGTRAAWDLVLQTLSAKPPRSAHHTVALAVARYGATIEPALRLEVAALLLGVIRKQKNRDIQSTIAKAITVVGSAKDLPALHAWLDKAESRTVRDNILQAIAACSERPEN